MRKLIRKILKEESDKQTDLDNSQSSENNICDDFSAESYENLVDLINKSHVSKEDDPIIEKLLNQLKSDMKKLDTDKDLINTYQHKIATQLCK
tara:strand:+ start:309 stop:587 length:279 start_codon:yes stop_codon:yes gene_type:complete